MKTAISIPDDIFTSADRMAKRLQMSRSELYAKAVKQYMAQNRHVGVKELLDAVYTGESSSIDPGLLDSQAASLVVEEW